MKDMQTEQLLCWSGMKDTEHSIMSGLNEEDPFLKITRCLGVNILPS